MNIEDKNTFSYRSLKEKFDLITSSGGKNWLLALNWIFVLEFTSTIIEYAFIQKAQNFIEPISSGFVKELSIAILIVLFIWYSIYNFIYMHKEKFFLFTLYISVCIYLLVTNDISFNLLLHNLNPFELMINGFSFYLIIQLILKILILYLIYKMLVAFKNRKNSN